jgi:cytoskeletal protein RodZ
VYYVPLWLLAVCLPVSALAIYLGLRETDLSRPLVYVLSAVLSPVLLLGTAFAAVVASTALQEPVGAPQDPASERQQPSREPASPADNPEPTVPEPTRPTASPTASPSASASASASPSADR